MKTEVVRPSWFKIQMIYTGRQGGMAKLIRNLSFKPRETNSTTNGPCSWQRCAVEFEEPKDYERAKDAYIISDEQKGN
jgi:hypothetical protein